MRHTSPHSFREIRVVVGREILHEIALGECWRVRIEVGANDGEVAAPAFQRVKEAAAQKRSDPDQQNRSLSDHRATVG